MLLHEMDATERDGDSKFLTGSGNATVLINQLPASGCRIIQSYLPCGANNTSTGNLRFGRVPSFLIFQLRFLFQVVTLRTK